VVSAGWRGADLDCVDAEQRFDLFVWVLDEDPGLASSGGARAEQRDDARLGCEVGDRDLDPLDSCAQEPDGVRCGGVGGVPVSRDRVACRGCRRLVRSGGGRGGHGVGPERVLAGVERAGDPGAVPRVWGASRKPALDGLDIDPDNVGELFKRQP
jgi:hypothetical protein